MSGGAAPGAGHQWCVTRARHLNENRSVLQRASQCPMRQGGNPGCPGGSLPVQLGGAGNLGAWNDAAYDAPWRDQVPAPFLVDQRLGLHGSGEPADEQTCSLKRGT